MNLLCYLILLTKVDLIGKVGITLNVDWYEPAVFNATEHIEACETKMQFFAGWFANPIFVNGQYPEIMRQKVFDISRFLTYSIFKDFQYSNDNNYKV